MNDNLTEIICIIDRSGSMNSVRQDAIGGFNAFVEQQAQEPGEARITVVLFNGEYQLLCDSVPLDDIRLSNQNFVPRGSTALLDAVGRTIDNVGKRLAATIEPERPGQVIVAILTDGAENSSRRYSRSQVASMIEHQTTKYSWEFVFLAANQDAITAARSISIAAADAVSFDSTAEGTQNAFQMQSAMVARKRQAKRAAQA